MMHVLYVDSDRDCLERGKQALEDRGRFSVDTTTSAVEASGRLAVKGYHAVLCGQSVDGMDALTFLMTVRSADTGVPIIFFFSMADEESAARAVKNGADLCLPKDTDTESQFLRLEPIIRSMVTEKQGKVQSSDDDIVFNSLDEMVLILDIDGNILRANAAATRMLHYSDDELRSMDVTMLYPLDQQEDAQRIYSGVLDGTMDSCPLPVITNDGRIIPVETRVIRGRWDNRDVFICVSRDISERLESEEALRRNEYLFRVVLNNANDAIFLLERTPEGPGRYILVNDTAVRMLGYSKYELLKMSPCDIVPDEVRKSVMPGVIRKLNQDRYATFESVHVRKDGSTYPVEVSTYTFRLGDKDVDLSVTRDIPERKRLLDSVQKNGEYLRTLVATTADILWETDEKSRFVYISPQVERILGYLPDELIGKTPFDFLDPSSVEANREAFRKATAAPGGYVSHESHWIHKSGHRVILESRAIPLTARDGSVIGFRGIDRDVTVQRDTGSSG